MGLPTGRVHRKLLSMQDDEAISAAAAGSTEPQSFEDALAKLEILVENMEEGDIPLAELVDAYTRGNELLKFCQSRLREAELKIEQLTSREDGDASFEPVSGGKA